MQLLSMVESHPREGEASATTNCPDKYIPATRRSVDREWSNDIHVGLDVHGYERWTHRHMDELYGVLVHRLQAVAEYGFDKVGGNVVHHKNGIPWDNRPENLEVTTQADHVRAHFESGKYGRTELSQEEVAHLRRTYDGSRTFKEIAEDYPVGHQAICNAIRGRSFEWVDEPPVPVGEGND